jgi:hypothetical protein
MKKAPELVLKPKLRFDAGKTVAADAEIEFC